MSEAPTAELRGGATKRGSHRLVCSGWNRTLRAGFRQADTAGELPEAGVGSKTFQPIVHREGRHLPFPFPKRSGKPFEGPVFVAKQGVVGCNIPQLRSRVGRERVSLCLRHLTQEVGPLGLGITGGAVRLFDGRGELFLATDSQCRQPFRHGFSQSPLSLVNRRGQTMTMLRVRIGVGDFAEVSQRLFVTTGPVESEAEGALVVRRKRIYGERPLLLSQRRAELAPDGKQVPVGLVGEGVVRV